MNLPLSAAAVIAALARSSAAFAAGGEAREGDNRRSDSACPERERGARLHDGLFVRSEPSLTFFRAIVWGSGTETRRSGIRGIGQGAGISIGGTPARGLVVGGSVWTARVDPVFIEDGKTVSPDDDSVKITLLRLGPFLDFYPDPSRGFHVVTAAALTVQVESDVKGNAIEPAALGAALSIGPGYEWFIMNEISMGLLGRVSVGRLVRSPNDGPEHILWIIPELALTATYH